MLHSFSGYPTDGQNPNYGALVQSGSTLYGMTLGGGSASGGTIFKINTDGTGYAIIHTFMGGAADGAHPEGQLLLSGATLYGMTLNGGSANDGTIFRINTDGSGFAVTHVFSGAPNDGFGPSAELTLDGSTLYGLAGGGTDTLGIIFGINTDGSDFEVIHSFVGGPDDGAYPGGDLTVSGSTLFGMTSAGGASNDGTVFSFTVVPEPSSFPLWAAGGLALFGHRSRP